MHPYHCSVAKIQLELVQPAAAGAVAVLGRKRMLTDPHSIQCLKAQPHIGDKLRLVHLEATPLRVGQQSLPSKMMILVAHALMVPEQLAVSRLLHVRKLFAVRRLPILHSG